MSDNEIVKSEPSSDFPERPAGAEVVRETVRKVKIGSRGEQELPTDIAFADGSFIKIEYGETKRGDPNLNKCMYCEGLPSPNPNCTVCHGSGETVPMQVGAPLSVKEFDAFAQNLENEDVVVMSELMKIDIKDLKELEYISGVLEVSRPRLLTDDIRIAFDSIRKQLPG